MHNRTIAQLAWYIPRSETASGMSRYKDLRGISASRASDIVHYAECYKNLQLGWDFAAVMAASEIPFPAILHGDDLCVWRAYRYIKGTDDGDVEAAVAIARVDRFKPIRTQINALLLSEGVDCDFIATRLGISTGAVRTYEKLFFNVLDRKEDHAFIADLVYPEGRIAEAFEDYIRRKDIDALMLRAGYNHGVKHVLYAAGLDKRHPYAAADAASGASTLDAMFMADGCLFADFGFAHQRRNAIPIANARMSMQAGKMGGGQQQGTGVANFKGVLRDELVTVSALKAQARARALVLEVDASIPNNAEEQQR